MAHQQQQKPRRPDLRGRKCDFCEKQTQHMDWKDYPLLKTHVDYFGNVRRRFLSGTCLQHQKMLRLAIERARFMGMLAYRK
ncbi:30S ribosomal protein S18 [Candidatus Peribacteria bacterium RIFCSPHIGHO2_01_FULL_55_13]|nr:MAG: 30S ribosomal protein S18 [Candidatus Peribacteria bacterium RIFCSPHIGHO2_01_FULL_55_13]